MTATWLVSSCLNLAHCTACQIHIALEICVRSCRLRSSKQNWLSSAILSCLFVHCGCGGGGELAADANVARCALCVLALSGSSQRRGQSREGGNWRRFSRSDQMKGKSSPQSILRGSGAGAGLSRAIIDECFVGGDGDGVSMRHAESVEHKF